MTEQERKDAFSQELNQFLITLSGKYGVNLEATILPKQYGSMLQIEAGLKLTLVEGWFPPPPVNE